MSVRKGDLIWATVFNSAGHEIAGQHPALVVSPTEFNNLTGKCVICSITSVNRGSLFEVLIPEGLPISGVIRIDELHSIDWQARKVRAVGSVPISVLGEVTEKLRVFLT